MKKYVQYCAQENGNERTSSTVAVAPLTWRVDECYMVSSVQASHQSHGHPLCALVQLQTGSCARHRALKIKSIWSYNNLHSCLHLKDVKVTSIFLFRKLKSKDFSIDVIKYLYLSGIK